MTVDTTDGLRVERLTKTFAGLHAVDDVSFEAAPGEFVSLLGPSGCGKTTTLRCIAGFEHPDDGRITLGGATLTDTAGGVFMPPNRRRFGMVFQSYAVWPHMTVFDNVAYPLTVQGGHSGAAIRERVLAQLDMVGLAGTQDRYPASLSGGQQQRVALARAIVMEPRALLFDEPLSNLDAKLRERMRFELLDIQTRLAVPAVYVTHDQTEAMVMSRKVIVMKDGRIAQSGSPEEIYEQPADRFVADFVGNCNFLDAMVTDATPDACRVRCALGDLQCDLSQIGCNGMSNGQKVLVVIRPERVALADEPFGGGNSFEATVRSRYFLGCCSEYLLDVAGLTVRAQTSTSHILKPGARVHAHVASKDCKIIREC
jgi:iron(III) transport system ATP-binding protein